MKFAGFDVTREYYINDGGNQINNLVLSIKARYDELKGLDVDSDSLDELYNALMENGIEVVAEGAADGEG